MLNSLGGFTVYLPIICKTDIMEKINITLYLFLHTHLDWISYIYSRMEQYLVYPLLVVTLLVTLLVCLLSVYYLFFRRTDTAIAKSKAKVRFLLRAFPCDVEGSVDPVEVAIALLRISNDTGISNESKKEWRERLIEFCINEHTVPNLADRTKLIQKFQGTALAGYLFSSRVLIFANKVKIREKPNPLYGKWYVTFMYVFQFPSPKMLFY